MSQGRQLYDYNAILFLALHFLLCEVQVTVECKQISNHGFCMGLRMNQRHKHAPFVKIIAAR
jgi:hypothetical protein